MEKRPRYLFVISFDGLSSMDFDFIKELPNFKDFLKEASYCKKVYSIYPSLTYPAHTTIVTGKYPKNHGIVDNTRLQINRSSPDWYWYRKDIKGDTLYDLAIRKGMKVVALLWPVTAKSKIQYNVPEIFPNRPWQNQIMVSLMNGSPLYQYKLNKLFGNLRKGIKQPYLDDFTHQSFLYSIKNLEAELFFVHYTDLDSQRHDYGFNSKEAREALLRHDKRLGEFLKVINEKAICDESAVILLGDHSSLDEDKVIYLNSWLKEKGFIKVNEKGKIINYQAVAKSCGGSAYIYTKDKDKNLLEALRLIFEEINQKFHCFEYIYNREEALKMGADPNCSFMLEANKGYYFLDEITDSFIKEISEEKEREDSSYTRSTHGYSPYKENYTTVFMAKGKGIKKGIVLETMNLIDEGPTLAKLLNLELKDSDGRVLEEILE
ncbi:MAG: alkaline phosphatase family protein [Epulopiscium sp.]|nr:alkaline phosphatase family protein [Candidatus Epulonipiscium sp.]